MKSNQILSSKERKVLEVYSGARNANLPVLQPLRFKETANASPGSQSSAVYVQSARAFALLGT